MQLIGYNMLDVSRLGALQLLSRQRYIAQTCPLYVAFWYFTTQPIKAQFFVELCYAVVAQIAFYAYIWWHIYSSSMQTFKDLYQTDVVLKRNVQQYCHKAKHSTYMNPLPVLACQFFKINYLHIVMNTGKKISFFYLKFTKTRKIDAF